MSTNKAYEKLSLERKQGQENGTVPPFFNTGGFGMFMQKYKYKVATPREQYERIARTAAKYSKREGAEAAFFNMLWSGILSPSTPVLSNLGTSRGLPISCAGSYTPDSVVGFYESKMETALLTKEGFGTSSYLGDVRSRGSRFKGNGKASGVVPLLKSFVNDMNLVSQGSNRRGAFAGYIPIDHGDFFELMDLIVADGDDLNVGINITDPFIARLESGDEEALSRWQRLLKVKALTGKPYLWYVDKANRKLPQVYKDGGLKNRASNLCSEILLPADEQHTYSCVLSSLNLIHWDEIASKAGTPDCYISWATEFLNCIVDAFLDQSKDYPGFEKIRRFTEKYRALGLGVCGYHSYLMTKRIPWESLEANWKNIEIFETIDKYAYSEGRFNASRIAIAPTKSTALIMGGVSEGCSPVPAFVYTQATAAGEVSRIDPVLLDLIKERVPLCDYDSELEFINANFGSVQKCKWLTDEEKQVFKTAFEIDQHSVIRHASVRGKYVDQYMSLNLFFAASAEESYISSVMKQAALDENIIGIYYMYSLAGISGSNGECVVCQ